MAATCSSRAGQSDNDVKCARMTEEKPAKITVLDAASVEPINGTPYPEPYDREPAPAKNALWAMPSGFVISASI